MAGGRTLAIMDQDPNHQHNWLAIATEPAALGDGSGLDRVMTAVAFLAALALILLTPLAG